MREWLSTVGGDGFATAIIWTLAALILLAIILVIARIIRNFTSGTFVAGGRHRAPRLAVVDAAAVDDKRRLVLVRRDEVEHLILIGGPTDIVIEQQIHGHQAAAGAPAPRREPPSVNVPAPQASASVRPGEGQHPRSRPAVAPAQRQEPPMARTAPAERPQPREATIAPPPPVRTEGTERSRPLPERDMPAARQETPRAAPVAAGAWQGEPGAARQHIEGPRQHENAGDTPLMEEIDLSIDEPRRQPASRSAPRQDVSIEDEMSRLLDDLSDERKKEG